MTEAQSPGRLRQKARTRASIVEAARRLREQGATLSLERVAEEAKMSRATVYRYFSSVSTLNVELGLEIQLKTPDQLLDPDEDDPLARMMQVHEHLFELVRSNEAEFRAYLKSTLDHWEQRRSDEPIRGARRIALVESALEGARQQLDPATFTKLVRSVSILTFIEPYMVLKDVFQADDEDADEVMRWAMTQLIRGALQAE